MKTRLEIACELLGWQGGTVAQVEKELGICGLLTDRKESAAYKLAYSNKCLVSLSFPFASFENPTFNMRADYLLGVLDCIREAKSYYIQQNGITRLNSWADWGTCAFCGIDVPRDLCYCSSCYDVNVKCNYKDRGLGCSACRVRYDCSQRKG